MMPGFKWDVDSSLLAESRVWNRLIPTQTSIIKPLRVSDWRQRVYSGLRMRCEEPCKIASLSNELEMRTGRNLMCQALQSYNLPIYLDRCYIISPYLNLERKKYSLRMQLVFSLYSLVFHFNGKSDYMDSLKIEEFAFALTSEVQQCKTCM